MDDITAGSYISNSAFETEELGRRFARALIAGHKLGSEWVFVALYGGLGAGKTAFVRGMASVLAPGARVTSPTYALVNEYRNPPLTLAHFDLYRVEGEDDLLSCGFDDYFRPGVIIAAEWCENIASALPGSYYTVKIERAGEGARRITIGRTGGGNQTGNTII